MTANEILEALKSANAPIEVYQSDSGVKRIVKGYSTSLLTTSGKVIQNRPSVKGEDNHWYPIYTTEGEERFITSPLEFHAEIEF